jgi:putative RecB family exonuclease
MQISRPHWSYSQLAQYLRCPLQYYFERIARLPKPFLPSGLVLGRAVHEGLAEYHRRLQKHQACSGEIIRKKFRAAWRQAESEGQIQYRPGETRQELIELGTTLLDTYLQQSPPAQIVAVEQTWVVPLVTSGGEILDKPLVAVVDLVVRESEQLVVTEFKTSSRRYSQADLDSAQQATSYAHVMQDRFARLPLIRYIVLVKTKTPTIQQIEAKRTAAEVLRLGDIFQSVEWAIAAGAFYPVESPQNCSGCAFREACRAWKGPSGPNSLKPEAGG